MLRGWLHRYSAAISTLRWRARALAPSAACRRLRFAKIPARCESALQHRATRIATSDLAAWWLLLHSFRSSSCNLRHCIDHLHQASSGTLFEAVLEDMTAHPQAAYSAQRCKRRDALAQAPPHMQDAASLTACLAAGLCAARRPEALHAAAARALKTQKMTFSNSCHKCHAATHALTPQKATQLISV